MMRLPKFRYLAPRSAGEAVEILRGEGPQASIVAGGTDLYPNMKRRHQVPKTLVSLRRIEGVRDLEWRDDGSVRIGPGLTLRTLERDERLAAKLPALHTAVKSISTPVLRNMGTIGGNLCLDTRCNYYDQNHEWRRAIDFCLKCEGDTCWVAPSSPICWAVNSSDSVPVMMALGATVTLASADGERRISADELYAAEDGREWLTKEPDELLTDIEIPDQGGARSVYLKLRRRGAFDFPVLGVAARVAGNGSVRRADLVLGALGPAPVRVTDAEELLAEKGLGDEAIEEAGKLAQKASKPLDNTDFTFGWRRKMVPVFVKRALRALRDPEEIMMRHAALVFTLSLLLVACGDAKEPAGPGPDDAGGANPPAEIGDTPLVAGETPEETFAAFRAATLRRDWNALYELNLPSERKASEARWEKVKHDPDKAAMLEETAASLDMTLEDLRKLSLRDYFMHRNAKQYAGHDFGKLQKVHEAEFLGSEPIEGDEDAVMVTFRYGASEPDMPLKREDGRYWIWKMLTAMTTY